MSRASASCSRVEQFAELEQDARAGQRRRRGPAGKRRGGGLRPRASTSAGAGEGDAAGLFSPVAGLKTSPPAPARALDALAVDEMVDVAHAGAPVRRIIG